jgi:hypothetical protein
MFELCLMILKKMVDNAKRDTVKDDANDETALVVREWRYGQHR